MASQNPIANATVTISDSPDPGFESFATFQSHERAMSDRFRNEDALAAWVSMVTGAARSAAATVEIIDTRV